MTSAKVFGVLLAGGASTRMRQDKSQLIFNGQSLFENARLTLSELKAFDVIDDFVVSGRGVDGVDDVHPNSGPVGGILSVIYTLKCRAGDILLVMPVDMPLLSSQALQYLLKEAIERNATVCFSGACLPMALIVNHRITQIADDHQRQSSVPTKGMPVKKLFAEARGFQVPPIDSTQLANVNTLEDWHHILNHLD